MGWRAYTQRRLIVDMGAGLAARDRERRLFVAAVSPVPDWVYADWRERFEEYAAAVWEERPMVAEHPAFRDPTRFDWPRLIG